MTKRGPHLQNPRSKRHRRRALALARKRFRSEMQTRKDLYALKFADHYGQREAERRLIKEWVRTAACWDLDGEGRLIVSRGQLVLFRGLSYRKTRMLSLADLWTRLERMLARYPALRPHASVSVPFERILALLEEWCYYPLTLYRRTKVTLLNAYLYARERGLLLSFTATTCG